MRRSVTDPVMRTEKETYKPAPSMENKESQAFWQSSMRQPDLGDSNARSTTGSGVDENLLDLRSGANE